MSTIKFLNIGDAEERFRKVSQCFNDSPVIFPMTLIDETPGGNVTTTADPLGGVCVDRAWLRTLAPDRLWLVRAAGWVNAIDANGIIISLRYQKDDTTTVTLGSLTVTGAGYQKVAMGPFAVFETVGVPRGESIPNINLYGAKVSSGTGHLTRWTLWLELRP